MREIGSVIEFLCEALTNFASFRIEVRQVMSNISPACRFFTVAALLQKLGIEPMLRLHKQAKKTASIDLKVA
jgi:hypothetical protein